MIISLISLTFLLSLYVFHDIYNDECNTVNLNKNNMYYLVFLSSVFCLILWPFTLLLNIAYIIGKLGESKIK